MTLKRKGPLADWRGRLALEAQGLASVETDLEIGLADLPRIGIEGPPGHGSGCVAAESP